MDAPACHQPQVWIHHSCAPLPLMPAWNEPKVLQQQWPIRQRHTPSHQLVQRVLPKAGCHFNVLPKAIMKIRQKTQKWETKSWNFQFHAKFQVGIPTKNQPGTTCSGSFAAGKAPWTPWTPLLLLRRFGTTKPTAKEWNISAPTAATAKDTFDLHRRLGSFCTYRKIRRFEFQWLKSWRFQKKQDANFISWCFECVDAYTHI